MAQESEEEFFYKYLKCLCSKLTLFALEDNDNPLAEKKIVVALKTKYSSKIPLINLDGIKKDSRY